MIRAPSQDGIEAVVAQAFRAEWGRIVAAVIARTGDWDLAEDCAQDAFAQALRRWERDGVPHNPGAWLMTTARNRAVDLLRRAAAGAQKLKEIATLPGNEEIAMLPETDETMQGGSAVSDDRLRLIFTCCHPALSTEAQVALTLRTLAGLTTGEIARAFLVSEATMSKRLVRAKQKIRNAGVPYRVPPDHLLPERTSAVLAVVYLLFNEGYAATTGPDMIRAALSTEAIRLARTLTSLMPDEPEVLGLLALVLLQDSRRDARTGPDGTLVPLDEQDRALWDHAAIEEGRRLLDRALRRSRPGPYQVQAAIAACHAAAPTSAQTDWDEIVLLYDSLVRLVPSPVVALNRAVAVAMASGPEAGLRLVDDLASGGRLDSYRLLPATRADLLRRAGRLTDAAAAYRQALTLAESDAERRYLRRRLAECAAPA